MSTSNPVAVEIVRRPPSAKSLAKKVVGDAAQHAIRAWIVMLILGAFTPWPLGYWQTFILLIGVDYLRYDTGHYKWWTTEVSR